MIIAEDPSPFLQGADFQFIFIIANLLRNKPEGKKPLYLSKG